MTVTKECSAVDNVSDLLDVRHGDAIDYTVALSGEGVTFDATLVLERSVAGAVWEKVKQVTAAATGRVYCEHPTLIPMKYRWRCTAFGESGDPVTVTIADVATLKSEVKGPTGDVAVRYTEAGVEIPGTLDVDGAADFDSTIDVAGAATLRSTVDVTGAATFGATVKATGVTASNVTKIVLDGSGNALIARCATANIPTGAGYAKGCLLIATDGTDNTNTLFCNIGNSTTANFNAATIAAD